MFVWSEQWHDFLYIFAQQTILKQTKLGSSAAEETTRNIWSCAHWGTRYCHARLSARATLRSVVNNRRKQWIIAKTLFPVDVKPFCWCYKVNKKILSSHRSSFSSTLQWELCMWNVLWGRLAEQRTRKTRRITERGCEALFEAGSSPEQFWIFQNFLFNLMKIAFFFLSNTQTFLLLQTTNTSHTVFLISTVPTVIKFVYIHICLGISFPKRFPMIKIFQIDSRSSSSFLLSIWKTKQSETNAHLESFLISGNVSDLDCKSKKNVASRSEKWSQWRSASAHQKLAPEHQLLSWFYSNFLSRWCD